MCSLVTGVHTCALPIFQALVGACAELGQARAEAVDALRLRGRQAVELLAQLAAAVALLLAQSRLKRAPGLAQQQHDQQDDRRAHGDQQQQQELGVGYAASVSDPVAANADRTSTSLNSSH